MLTQDDFNEIWCSGHRMYTYDPTALANISLPTSAKEFLMNVGMYMCHLNYFPVSHVYTDLPSIRSLAFSEYEVPAICERLRVFAGYGDGTNMYVYYCLEAESGAVYAVLQSKRLQRYQAGYCNNSINHLIRFVLIIEEYQMWYATWRASVTADQETLDNPVLHAKVNGVLKRLISCDPSATKEVQEYLDGYRPIDDLNQATLAWTQMLVQLANQGYWSSW